MKSVVSTARCSGGTCASVVFETWLGLAWKGDQLVSAGMDGVVCVWDA